MKLPHATALNQIAYVTHDIEASITWWIEKMGVGPFLLLRDIVFDRSDYLGKTRPVTYSAAVSYSGDLCVELIEPNGPSIFHDWLTAGRTGVQHLCVFTDDFQSTAAAIEAKGGKRIQGGLISGGEIAFFAMGDDQDIILEVAQLSPESQRMFDAVKAAATNWDGNQRYVALGGELIAAAPK